MPQGLPVAHDIPLIAMVAIGLGLAFLFGFGAARLKLPPLVGYLLAGVAVGPFTPGFVGDASLARQLAEIGVILLMFGVGTHFSLRDLWAVRRIAFPGALVQMAVAAALGFAVARGWAWPPAGALVFGLSVSVASTVVMLRTLGDRALLDSVDGRIAVGWLVVQDLVMVLVLILLPTLAGFLGDEPRQVAHAGDGLLTTVLHTVGKIAVFFALMYAVGVRVFPWLFGQLSRVGSRELLTLFVTAVAISIAYGASELFGVSFALGAFVAGVVINEADLSHRTATQVEALEHVFTVLFFVSVGMLFNPAVLVDEPFRVLTVVAIIMLGTPLVALAVVLAFRYPLRTALTLAASIGQIGEFSFILAGLGVALGLLPAEGRDLVLAGALITITLNPATFEVPAFLARRFPAWQDLMARFGREGGDLAALPAGALPRDHVVLIGYGRVGRTIGRRMAGVGIPYVVIEQNREIVGRLRKKGAPALAGDSAAPGVLDKAGLATARLVVVAIPDAFQARQTFELVKQSAPHVAVAVRTHSETELAHFERRGADLVLMAERELAAAMGKFVLGRYTASGR